MRKFITPVLLLVCFAASAAERPVTTSITGVKVFLSGAEVTRTGKIQLEKGVATLLVAGLSQEVDPSNIQVTGSGAFTILGVQHRLNYLEEKQDRTEVVALEAKIKAMEADIAREQALLEVLNKEDARLAKNDVVAGDQGLSLEQLRTINEYLQTRQEAITIKRLDKQAHIQQLGEEVNKLRMQMNQLQGKKPQPTSEIVVEVSANAPVEATLSVKYLVRSAGWAPNYDIRVSDITKPMMLTYKAQVYQNTGEDWSKVALALSSGEPNKDAIMPELRPWRLDFGVPPLTNYKPQAAANANVHDVRGIVRDGSTGEPLPFVNVMLFDENGQLINGTTTNMDGYYAIAIPVNGRSLKFSYVGYSEQSLSLYSNTINANMYA
ncbi:MAG TPA: mucoidy inhibitor MuiA family protein, partial [Flavobacteriales bacterium]|nr:mucoidy inhibitor MuiA family protein [Flavobacteriales bacterium]